MTTEELRQHKKEYNAKIAELKRKYRLKQLMILNLENEKEALMTNLFDAIADHERVCDEFDEAKL